MICEDGGVPGVLGTPWRRTVAPLGAARLPVALLQLFD